MWQALRLSRETSAEFVSSVDELGKRTATKLILTTGVLYLGWHVVATLLWPGGLGWHIWLVSPAVLLTCALAWYLLQRHYLLSQVVWQVGLVASITLGIVVFGEYRLAYLFSLLPLMAVVMIGWQAAALVEVMVAGVVWWLSMGGIPGVRLPVEDTLVILVCGALAGILGWASSDSLLMVVHWSLSSYAQARDTMEELRQHRGQLARVLKDLDQAYYRLQRANASLVAAWKAADEAERFRAEFATNISHELRTPLNLIIGFSEMMTTAPESYGAPLPGPYRSDLNSIYRSAQHLLALVDDVLDLARIDAGKIVLSRDQVSLAVLVREATDVVRDYIAAKGLDLQVHMPEDLPCLWLDSLRIRQVLLNLLVNAARFTEQGSISLDVTVREQESEVLVRVTDTGRGIPLEDLPRIFEEFTKREDPGKSPWAWHSGSGLGLPISKRFVEMHQGRMGVESAQQYGTTIWFTLPYAHQPAVPAIAPEVGATPRPIVMPRSPAAPRRMGEERIIITLHEDPGLAHFLQRHLESYRVVGASNPAELSGLIDELKPIAVLTDGAVGLDGVADSAPAVVTCPLPSKLRAAHALGACDLLIKPVSREELFAAIDRIGRPVGRVLIVDDDPDMVRVFRRMLSASIGAQNCLEAYSGEEAWSVLRAERPDLLLLDLMMPDINGQEVLRRMAADAELATIPVIIVSAQAQESLRVQLPGDIRITPPDHYRLSDVMRVLESVFSALSPGWD